MSAAQKLKFSIRPNPSPVAADVRAGLLKDPGFGRVFSDHMVTIRWTKDGGWQDAQLRAREPIAGLERLLAGHVPQLRHLRRGRLRRDESPAFRSS